MEPAEIALVRRTHAILLPRAAAIGAGFYDNLFIQRPALRDRFPENLDAQIRKLMDMLATVVELLDHPERLLANCHELGQLHRGYGAEEADYDQIGVALLHALRDGLGTEYTEAIEAAWAGLYGEVAEAMIAGQQDSDRD